MKKIYSLLTAVCVLFMIGCSDDDDEKKLDKTYKDSDLALKLNGNDITGATVKFTSNDFTNGEITFTNLFLGETTSKVDVKMTQNSTDADTYDFTGNADNGKRKVTVTGTVGSKLTLTTTFEVISPIARKWQPMTLASTDYTLNLIITPKSDDATIDMCGIFGKNAVPLKGENSFTSIIGQKSNEVFTGMVDFKLDMKKDGLLVAYWEPSPLNPEMQFPKGNSENTVVSYNVVENQVIVKLPMTEWIGGLLPTGRADAGLEILAKILQGEFPLNLEVSDTKLSAKVTKEMMTPYLPVIEQYLLPLLKDIEITNETLLYMGITGENLSNFMAEAIRVINESSQFTLEINMVPATE